MNPANSAEFHTEDEDFPTRIFCETISIGDMRKETTGCSGTSALWIFGSPQIRGITPDEQS